MGVEPSTFENRGIEKILSYSTLCIDEGYGLRALNQYLTDLQMLRSGAPYASLGISQRRERSTPAVISTVGEKPEVIADRGLIKNERLTPRGSIALIKLDGVMSSEDDGSSYGVSYQIGHIRAAYSNSNISAIILEVNSGGGEALAMQMLISALQERNKPVIGFGHFVASAAYGTVAATDEVVASNADAEFGSIGAVMTINKEFLQVYKESFEAFYGDNAPKKNEHLREALKGNFSPIQDIANKATDSFHAQVAAMRPLTGGEAYKKQTLSGAMFDASEAKRRGLIDGVGNLNYAIKRAQAWASKQTQKQK